MSGDDVRRRPSPLPPPDPDADFLGDTFGTSIAPPVAPPPVAPQWVSPEYRARVTMGDRFADALPGTARRSLEAIGGLYSMFGASLYGLGSDLVRRKFQFNEFVERSWFLVSVSLLPAILVSVP